MKKLRQHLQRIADMPCSACGGEPVECHHPRVYPLSSAGRKASDVFAIPLCPDCHRWYHASPEAWEMANGSQISHVEKTLAQILRGSER